MAPREQAAVHDNGVGQYDFDPIEQFDPTDIKPDAPAGGWEFSIPHNGVQRKATRPKTDGDKRRPMLIIPVQLKRALDEENEGHEGSQVDFMVIAWGEDKVRAGNASKRELAQFCDAIGVDIGLFPHADALAAGSFSAFDDFVNEIEGKEGTCWTFHQHQDDGQVNTRVTFRKPKGLVAGGSRRASDDEEPEAKPAAKSNGRNGASAPAKKPAAKSSRR